MQDSNGNGRRKDDRRNSDTPYTGVERRKHERRAPGDRRERERPGGGASG